MANTLLRVILRAILLVLMAGGVVTAILGSAMVCRPNHDAGIALIGVVALVGGTVVGGTAYYCLDSVSNGPLTQRRRDRG
jgi:hypothetical protein